MKQRIKVDLKKYENANKYSVIKLNGIEYYVNDKRIIKDLDTNIVEHYLIVSVNDEV